MSALITPVPAQDTKAKQPPIAPDVAALLVTAGCTVKWLGTVWTIARKGKSFALSSRYNEGASFENWQAAVKSVVDATG